MEVGSDSVGWGIRLTINDFITPALGEHTDRRGKLLTKGSPLAFLILHFSRKQTVRLSNISVLYTWDPSVQDLHSLRS